MTTIKFNSVFDLLDAYPTYEDHMSGTEYEEMCKEYTSGLGFNADAVVLRPCLLQEDEGIYASFSDGKNFLFAESSDLNSDHLRGPGNFTVCAIHTPNGEMFDESEVTTTQLGRFDDFAQAYEVFASVIKERT